MIEQYLAERMQSAVTAEPPLGFDPDDVVDRAARHSVRRRATAAVALGTAALAVAVIAATPTPVTTTQPASPTSTSTWTEPVDSAHASVARRLSEVGPQVIAAYAPGVKVGDPEIPASDHFPPMVVATYPVMGVTDQYIAFSVVQSGRGLNLEGILAVADAQIEVSADMDADGALMMVFRSGTGHTLTVVVARPNGTVVAASATGPVVNQQVLTQMARDSRLVF
jgi:hypothetical protein